ncbi:MAG: prolipoprotein diacylglyceryl transferase [Desulfomonile tiedjei]|nr:prolipoprotein diacylglyceryl transferase [Desulfomonile tiedjei]
MTVHYPFIDPVLIHIGSLDLGWFHTPPLEVRWYGVMYLAGFALAYLIIRSELRRKQGPIPPEGAEDFLFQLILGVLIGGRLGYVLFYNLSVYVSAPWEILAVWNGGMSFHGGLIGMVVLGFLFARRHHASFLELADIGALAATPGLMLGRLGNFINGELFGRVTTAPWGIVFPLGGPLPRHPSQLYESLFEGLILFLILWSLRRRLRIHGQLLGVFLIGYGIFRFLIELVREPDPQLGFVFEGLTMGQILCLCMIVGGISLLLFLRGQRAGTNRSPGTKKETNGFSAG